MKIFTSAIEAICTYTSDKKKVYFADFVAERGIKLKWNLMSYYYLKGHLENAVTVRDLSDLVMIDSGAHSFQFGKKVDWDAYTKEYAEFIRRFDRENVVGYFEMDIENIVGYEKVLQLRQVLESVSDKIIPVWHPLRGINDYERMLDAYQGKTVAIGGFKNTDIKDSQYLSFVKKAKKYGCKVHCLGMTRKEVLDSVPFDYTDSSTWVIATNMGHPLRDGQQHGRVGDKIFRKATGIEKFEQFRYNYERFSEIQDKYYRRWRAECRD